MNPQEQNYYLFLKNECTLRIEENWTSLFSHFYEQSLDIF